MESEEECFRFGHVMKKQRKKERRRTSKELWSVIYLRKSVRVRGWLLELFGYEGQRENKSSVT